MLTAHLKEAAGSLEVVQSVKRSVIALALLMAACTTAGPQVDPAVSIPPDRAAGLELTRAGRPKTACDTRPLAHVYDPSRLDVIRTCKVFRGKVQGTQLEDDGDYHIYLTPTDAERDWAMNDVNRLYGWALAERMPMQQSIPVPEAGDR